CGMRNAECGIAATPHSAFRTPHSPTLAIPEPYAFGEIGLLDVKSPRLLDRRRARMHELARRDVANARETFRRRMHFVGAQRERFLPRHLWSANRIVRIRLVEKGALFPIQFHETIFENALPDLAHEPVVKVDVVLAEELPAEGLA